jgi:hypothetical protein
MSLGFCADREIESMCFCEDECDEFDRMAGLVPAADGAP